jgi:hypothetical protein
MNRDVHPQAVNFEAFSLPASSHKPKLADTPSRSADRFIRRGFILLLAATICAAFYDDLKKISQTLALFVMGGILTSLAILYLKGYKGKSVDLSRQALVLRRFAQDNHWTYTEQIQQPTYPGVLFQQPVHYINFDHVLEGTTNGQDFVAGQIMPITGQGEFAVAGGCMILPLTRQLPHVLLESKKHGGWLTANTNKFKADQKFQLEGDFNNYFDVYVPAAYERDMLYFLSPELMAVLIDYGSDFSFEVVNNYLLVYSAGLYKLEDEHAVRQLVLIAAVIGREFQENTSRYSDSTVRDRKTDIVMPRGRKLRTKVHFGDKIMMTALVIYGISLILGVVYLAQY